MKRRAKPNNDLAIRTCDQVVERLDGRPISPRGVWQAERRAIAKLKDRLGRDPVIREWLREKGLVEA